MKNRRKALITDYYGTFYNVINKDLDFNKYKTEMMAEFGQFIKRDDSILDIGCGAGMLLRCLEENGYRRLYGAEANQSQFNEAKINLKYTNIENKDASDYLIDKKNMFNVIFMIDLLEHIEKNSVVDLLKLAHNSLSARGLLLIRTPNADSPLFCGRMRYSDFTHEIMLNETSINMILKDAGFSNIVCRPAMESRGGVLSLVKILVKNICETILRTYLRTYDTKAFKVILTPNFITIAKK